MSAFHDAVYLYYSHVLEETAAAGFKTRENLCLTQFDGWTVSPHRTIIAKIVP